MKKIITTIILISLMLTSVVYAQDTSILLLTGRVYKRNVNEFSSATRENNSNLVNTEITNYTWKDSKDNVYPIYITSNGSCFIYRTSNKTGKKYKQYMKVEISQQICNELGREYKGKRKSQITSECCEDIDIRKILNNSKHPVRRMRKILLVLSKNYIIMCNNTPNDDNVNINDYDIQIVADYYNHDYDDVDFMNHQENETNQTNILFE